MAFQGNGIRPYDLSGAALHRRVTCSQDRYTQIPFSLSLHTHTHIYSTPTEPEESAPFLSSAFDRPKQHTNKNQEFSFLFILEKKNFFEINFASDPGNLLRELGPAKSAVNDSDLVCLFDGISDKRIISATTCLHLCSQGKIINFDGTTL